MRKSTLVVLLLCAPVSPVLAGPPTASVAAAPGRTSVSLAESWRFRFGADGEAPAAPTFDDSGWEKVSVPHSWDVIGEYAPKRSAEASNAQGVGWYRLTVNAPAATSRQRQYLDFAAVGAVADVWVNGVHVGQHKGAFSRFRFDVTAQWKPGAANVVAVRADNSKPASGSSTEDVIPLAGDFFVHGGVYRGVSLVTLNELGIDLLDFAGTSGRAVVAAIEVSK